MKLENRIFNGESYTLVEIYQNKKYGEIYHFASDDADIFCKKDETGYIQITDEKIIDDIMEEYGLKQQDIFFDFSVLDGLVHKLQGYKNIKELPEDKREEVIRTQIDLLMQYKPELDRSAFEKIMSKVPLYTATFPEKSMWEGFYSFDANSIIYDEDAFQRDESLIYDEKEIHSGLLLHEMVHAFTGKACASAYGRMKGFLEGATEKLTRDVYVNRYKDASYNMSYAENVSIIDKMEYMMGESCDNDILTGKREFFDRFAQKYGKDIFRTLAHRATRLSSNLEREDHEFWNKYIDETEVFTYTALFDKEFEDLEENLTMDDAKKYLEKMQGFQTRFANRNLKEANRFGDYYDSKLSEIKRIFIEKGYPSSYMDIALKDYEFRIREEGAKSPGKFKIQELDEKDILIRTIVKKVMDDPSATAEKYKDFKVFSGKSEEGKKFIVVTEAGKLVRLSMQGEYGNRHYTADKIPEYEHVSIVESEEGLSIVPFGRGASLPIELTEKTFEEINEQRMQLEIDNEGKRRQGRQAYENRKRMEELKKVASKQKVSVISKVAAGIKGMVLNRGDKGKEAEDRNDDR